MMYHDPQIRRQSMKKILSLFPIALFAVTMHAQNMPASATSSAAQSTHAAISQHAAHITANQAANAAAQARHASTQAAEATHLSARLTKQINTRHAKVGDKVLARTTQSVKLSNGIRLPRGTHLVGHVTHVQASSRARHEAQLAFTFDRAILRHGRQIPIHAVLTSVSVPSAMAAANAMGNMNAGPDGGGAMAGAMAAPAPGGGGLLGGGAVGGALNTAGGAVGHGAAMAGSGLDAAGRAGAGMTGSALGQAAASGHAMSALNGEPMPVAHLPGVIMSSAANSSSSGTFSSSRRNFSLDSGTVMNMNVTADNSSAHAGGAAAASAHGSENRR
jgi:hypothetical protein